MESAELERLSASGMVIDENCDVVVLVTTIVDPPDYEEAR
jgi:hypothetical protein